MGLTTLPVEFLLDSNVLIHALNGSRASAGAFLDREADSVLTISLISWMEVMTVATDLTRDRTRSFLASFHAVHGITLEIAEKAVEIRKAMKLKLPDAIIYATALVTGSTLATYNSRDYPTGTAWVITPEE